MKNFELKENILETLYDLYDAAKSNSQKLKIAEHILEIEPDNYFYKFVRLTFLKLKDDERIEEFIKLKEEYKAYIESEHEINFNNINKNVENGEGLINLFDFNDCRSYMFLLSELAKLYIKKNETDKYIALFEEMLQISPFDNMGIRESLALIYFAYNHNDKLELLLNHYYSDDDLAILLISKYLEYKKGLINIEQFANCILEANPYFYYYLIGTLTISKESFNIFSIQPYYKHKTYQQLIALIYMTKQIKLVGLYKDIGKEFKNYHIKYDIKYLMPNYYSRLLCDYLAFESMTTNDYYLNSINLGIFLDFLLGKSSKYNILKAYGSIKENEIKFVIEMIKDLQSNDFLSYKEINEKNIYKTSLLISPYLSDILESYLITIY